VDYYLTTDFGSDYLEQTKIETILTIFEQELKILHRSKSLPNIGHDLIKCLHGPKASNAMVTMKI